MRRGHARRLHMATARQRVFRGYASRVANYTTTTQSIGKITSTNEARRNITQNARYTALQAPEVHAKPSPRTHKPQWPYPFNLTILEALHR